MKTKNVPGEYGINAEFNDGDFKFLKIKGIEYNPNGHNIAINFNFLGQEFSLKYGGGEFNVILNNTKYVIAKQKQGDIESSFETPYAAFSAVARTFDNYVRRLKYLECDVFAVVRGAANMLIKVSQRTSKDDFTPIKDARRR